MTHYTLSPPSIWQGQLAHLAAGLLLLALVAGAWIYLGKPHADAFWLAVVFPIAHQVFVWLAWRLELASGLISRSMGFRLYLAAFFLLFAGRFAALLALAWLDRGSLQLELWPRALMTSLLLMIGLYTLYSVKRYFGMARAAGADHFDPSYRSMPLVQKGIFRFSSNAMYAYAFAVFWAIAIGFNSLAGLVVAAFSHCYIWVHYFCTEKPDMDYLYSNKS